MKIHTVETTREGRYAVVENRKRTVVITQDIAAAITAAAALNGEAVWSIDPRNEQKEAA